MIHVSRSIRRVCGASIIVAATLAFQPAAAAQTEPVASMSYHLADSATYGFGCYDGCACPIIMLQMLGGFTLTLVNVDPLFTNYRVDDFRAIVHHPEGNFLIEGSGTYRVGGEVAIMHQMTLDATLNGTLRRFDSGLVQGGGQFPEISIDLAANAFACYDTVLTVDALPATVGIGDPESASLGAVPNPFRTGLELRFEQRAPGPVEAAVFDVRGRLVRTLLSDAWSNAGPRTIAWDGRLANGAGAPAGLYVARIRAAGKESTRRIIKIE